jgi:DNA polymerase
MSDMRHVLHHDIETRSRIDLKRAGAARYAADSSTEVMCLGFAVDDGPVKIWSMWNNDPVPPEFIAAANNPNWLIASHNDYFERSVAQHILGPRHGFPAIPIERRRCSMAAAYAAALPGSLEKVIAALGLPFGKDKAGQALMKRMSKPRSDGSWIEDEASRERLYQYVAHDVESERAVSKALPPLIDAEQKLWQLDAEINARGFAIDVPLLEAALRIVTGTQAKFQMEFHKLTNLDSTNQIEKFIAWLAANDCIVSDVQKGTLKAALRRKNLTPEVRRAIELRLQLAHASAGKVNALLAWRGADDRVRGTLKFHGAGTGRWAGSGPQPQNFKRDAEGTDEKIAAIMNGGEGLASPVEAVGEIARGTICAAPGHRLLIGDYGAIESRVAAWASDQQSKIDLWKRFDQTGDPNNDPYVVFGRAIGHPETRARAYGKVGDLAFGFGGGVGAWRNFAPEEDNSDEATIKQYRDTWRAQHPKTVQFWYALDRAAISAIRSPGTDHRVGRFTYRFDAPFLRVKLPSGRSISYPFAAIMPEPDRFGHPRATFLDTAGGGFGPCNFGRGAWGGIWCENVVSGVARDLLAAAMVRLEAAGYPVTLHVHDEIVCEAPIEFGSVEEFQRLITTLPDWAEGLPVAAKVRNGQRFAKSETANPGTFDETHGDAHDDLLDRVSADEENEHNGADGDEYDHDDNHTNQQHAGSNDGYSHGERDTGQRVAFFIYRHADGQPCLGVKKTSTKQFPQYHWDGGKWAKGAPKGPKIPYRLPELIKTPLDALIIIAAGEKDAETAAALSFVATTNPGGEGKGKWLPELNAWFAGRKHVAIMEDNDATGRAHVLEVAEALRNIVPDIRIVTFRDLPEHGDLTDWKERGHGRDDLLAKIETTKPYHPQPQASPIRQWDAEPVPELEYAVPDRFPLENVGLFSGEGGQGKSSLVQQLCVTHALEQQEWLGCIPRHGPAIYIECEDAERVLHWRLKAIATHYNVTLADIADGGFQMYPLADEENAVLATAPDKTGIVRPTALYDWLYELAGDLKPVMIGIASSANVFAGNENVRTEVQQFIRLLRRIARVAHGTVLLVTQPSLTGIENKSASHEGLAGTTQWHNAVRARAVMKSVKPEDGIDTGLRTIVFHKNQYGPASATCFVRYENGLFLPVAGMSMDAAERATKAEELFVALLRKFTAQHQIVNHASGRSYAPARFAEHPEAQGITRKEFAHAMQRLLDAKVIEIRQWGRPSRPAYYLALIRED